MKTDQAPHVAKMLSVLGLAAFACIGSQAFAAAATGDGVARTTTTLLGLAVDQYSWTDSQGRPRTVAFKQQGNGNPGNGGYAVQMTYQVPQGVDWRTVTVNMSNSGDGGFGYFVAHELYRNFSDGSSGTIAALHGQDDSPLGLDFPAVGSSSTITPTTTVAMQTFQLTYPKWATLAAMADPSANVPVDSSAHVLYQVPVTIVWTFQKGTDFPRIDFRVDISASTQGQLAFDMRGPYGVMEFADGDGNATINNVQWRDTAYRFTTAVAPTGFLQRDSSWQWSSPVGIEHPYHALIARHSTSGVLYETGLIEMKLGDDNGLVYSGYASHRGENGVGFYPAAGGIEQYEWPFQSAQYSGGAADGGWLANQPIYGKKFAWGSAPFYGSRLSTVYLNDTTPASIDAYPNGGTIVYRTCWVIGESTYTGPGTAGLTESLAANPETRCATATETPAAPLSYSVSARATHGAAGTFDLPIDLSAGVDSNAITVEPRAAETGNRRRLVFNFADPIHSVGGVLLAGVPASNLATGTAATPSIAGNSVTVLLSNVPDRKRLQVTLTGINGVAGADATAALAYLFGDVTGDRQVTGLDSAVTGAKSPISVTTENFLYNVSLSGGITALDRALVGASVPKAVE